MKRLRLLLPALLLAAGSLSAQDGFDEPSAWALKGYIKDLRTFTLLPDSLSVDNLLHNRLNLRWYPTDNITAVLELRNRLFYGDLVRSFPLYSRYIDAGNDYVDLSVTPVDDRSIILHSMIDRLYVEWLREHLEVRVGRQRVNWGMTLVWNPNDIFNAYSFFDFDYEERPGSDALRVRYYTGVASSAEVAVKAADHIRDLVAAGLWRINEWNYDFQVLAGVARGDVTLGGGWAGNISDAGFKGELTYFHPFGWDTTGTLLATIAADYSFPNSLYLTGAVLYNSDGASDASFFDLASTAVGRITAKQLSPYTVSTFLQAMYPFHPLVNGGLAFMYFPGDNSLFVNPVVTVSLAENFDLDAIAQLFFTEQNGAYIGASKQIFTRLKWSF